MNGLYPIIRRVRRPLVPLVEGTTPPALSALGVGGADAKPDQAAKPTETRPEAGPDDADAHQSKNNAKAVRK
jgi:hypothetical protein